MRVFFALQIRIDIPAQRIKLSNSVEGIALKCASSAIFQLLITLDNFQKVEFATLSRNSSPSFQSCM